VVAVAGPRRVVRGQRAGAGPANAAALFRPVGERARQTGVVARVFADAALARERNHHYMRNQLGAASSIPAKRGQSTGQLPGIRAQMRANFPAARDRPPTLVARVFSLSAAKRQRSARAPGRLPITQPLQTLRLGLAYDISRVRRALVPFAS
jgi:hypothetical protein